MTNFHHEDRREKLRRAKEMRRKREKRERERLKRGAYGDLKTREEAAKLKAETAATRRQTMINFSPAAAAAAETAPVRRSYNLGRPLPPPQPVAPIELDSVFAPGGVFHGPISAVLPTTQSVDEYHCLICGAAIFVCSLVGSAISGSCLFAWSSVSPRVSCRLTGCMTGGCRWFHESAVCGRARYLGTASGCGAVYRTTDRRCVGCAAGLGAGRDGEHDAQRVRAEGGGARQRPHSSSPKQRPSPHLTHCCCSGNPSNNDPPFFNKYVSASRLRQELAIIILCVKEKLAEEPERRRGCRVQKANKERRYSSSMACACCGCCCCGCGCG